MKASVVVAGALIALAIVGYGWMQRDASIRQSAAIESAAKTEAKTNLEVQEMKSRDEQNKNTKWSWEQ